MTHALVCPACGARHGAHERFCEDCGVPLVHAPGFEGPPKSELADLPDFKDVPAADRNTAAMAAE